MPNMCKLYFEQIQSGARTIDTVPAMLKAGVQALIDADAPQTKVAEPTEAPHVDAIPTNTDAEAEAK